MSTTKYRPVVVIWRDAMSEDPWASIDDIVPAYARIRTVGQHIAESEDVLTVGLNHDMDNDNWSCIIHIPKGMIESITDK
jgi:hypothetical protein